MNVAKWNPWSEMETFSDRFNRLFDGTFLPASRLNDEQGFQKWRPVVDIFNHDDKTVIKAELPGVDKKDIHIDVKDGLMTLRGERFYENEVKDEKYHQKERVLGKFHRLFALPEGLDNNKIEANYKDGVLRIEIPKPGEKKPKKITVH